MGAAAVTERGAKCRAEKRLKFVARPANQARRFPD
jgi:hypothetical protein